MNEFWAISFKPPEGQEAMSDAQEAMVKELQSAWPNATQEQLDRAEDLFVRVRKAEKQKLTYVKAKKKKETP